MNELLGQNRKGNAILCRFHGESDCTIIFVALNAEELRQAIIDNYTGDPDSEETKSTLSAIDAHDFHDEHILTFEFEIGHMSFEDVFSY